jgi:bla regulator protein blaR1
MSGQILGAELRSVAVLFGDHVWQSSVCAAIVSWLAWGFRSESAAVRYRLWLVASAKFLVPLWVLLETGRRIGTLRQISVTTPKWYQAVVRVGQPLAEANSSASQAAPMIRHGAYSTFEMITAIWLIGVAVVASGYARRWFQAWRIARCAEVVTGKTESQALLTAMHSFLTIQHATLATSEHVTAPCVFGIWRPKLLWPRGLSERLDERHMAAIIAHELAHVRRRDNLAALMQIVAEALFWFNPLVWRIGKNLLEERERACDEDVLRLCGDRKAYAESIVRLGQYCVGAPLAAVSGASSANLERRVTRILQSAVPRRLGIGRRSLLASMGVLAIGLPLVFGYTRAVPSARASQEVNVRGAVGVLEDVTVQLNRAGTESLRTLEGVIEQEMGFTPDRFTAKNNTVQELLRMSFQLQDYQIVGAPTWFATELYDINARISKTGAKDLQKLGFEERELQDRLMLQNVLLKEFRIKAHRETHTLPSYSLEVLTRGKLVEGKSNCDPHEFVGAPCESLRGFFGQGKMDGRNVPMSRLAVALSDETKRQVTDNTRLNGKYDVSLEWRPERSEFAKLPKAAQKVLSYDSMAKRPELAQAVEQQLGLKLVPVDAQVQLFVVDSAEKPPEK